MRRGLVRIRALTIAAAVVAGWSWALPALVDITRTSVDAVRAPGPATPEAVLVALAAAATTALLAWLGLAAVASLPTAVAETRRRRHRGPAEGHLRVGLLTPSLQLEADLGLAVPGSRSAVPSGPSVAAARTTPRPSPSAPVSPWLVLAPPTIRRCVAGLVVAAVLGTTAAQTAAASDLAPGRVLSPAWGDTTSAPADPLSPAWPGGGTVASPPARVAPDVPTQTASPAPPTGAQSAAPTPLSEGSVAGTPASAARDLLAPGWAPPAPPVAKPQVTLPGTALRPAAALDGATVVRRGDSLWDIAARHLGAGAGDAEIAAEWPRWWAQNRALIGADPDRLEPGQQLTAPP